MRGRKKKQGWLHHIAWVWYVALIERGLVAAVSVSPTICDHPHFTDEGLKAPTCALHLLSYLSLILGVKPSGPS